MSRNLLFGYYAISEHNLWDLGNEPYFHSKPFSWGICRPNCRGKVEIGTRIFFYTFKAHGRISDFHLTGMMSGVIEIIKVFRPFIIERVMFERKLRFFRK